ncbi:sugar phosphate isomerase/epimerase [Tetragenococcus halophilus]|uniref:sugar phosphate isomerase/epimerase n=1 Tax=Tetragenococcus halophilus TaxID=51669 RepID=UPI001031E113
MDTKKIAAQMYSVRKELEKDPEETFRRLYEIGFRAIQLDGMRGHDPYIIKHLVDKYQFKIAGMHIKHDRFINDLDGIIEESYLFDCKTIYNKYIEDEDQTETGYIKTKQAMIEAAMKLSPLGFRIGLHSPEYNYAEKINNRNILDFFTQPVNGTMIYAEPDTYWIHRSGLNVLDEFKKFSKISPIVHLKNCSAEIKEDDEMYNLTEPVLDAGIIDINSVVEHCLDSGIEYFCIEQDYSEINIFDNLKRGFNYLSKL